MKLLQNRWVSGGLAMLAVGVLGYQLGPQFGLRLSRGRVPAPKPAAARSVVTAEHVVATTPAQSPARRVSSSEPRINCAYIQERLPEWVDSPKRDPFLLLGSQTAGLLFSTNTYVSPVTQWELKAIWRQTDARMAAINKGVYREGDRIDGYKLERIEEDSVVFRGTNGTERLRFRRPAIADAPLPGDSKQAKPAPTGSQPERALTTGAKEDRPAIRSGMRTNLYYRP